MKDKTKPDFQTLLPTQAAELARRMPAGELAAGIAATFKILGDPTRVKILYLLSQGELCVHDLAVLLDASESATSHHLQILRMMRLVKGRKEGRLVYYSLDDEHVLVILQACSDHVEHREG